MTLRRPLPFPPDTRADTHRIVAVISRSTWLSIAVVALLLAVSVWFLLRLRRRLAKQSSMHFLLNSVILITVLIFVLIGLAAVNTLVEPAAELQAFFGVWCLPPPQATVPIFIAVCFVVTIFEAVSAKAPPG